ncbi:MAG: hypothetical protein ACTSUV_06210 [Candidatus Ranarchaeia archaeon]
MEFNLLKFILTVIDPQPNEKISFILDLPHEGIKDNPIWKDRREDIAPRWHAIFTELGIDRSFEVNPLIFYRADISQNFEFPEEGIMNEESINLASILSNSTLVVSMTEFNSNNALRKIATGNSDFRAINLFKISAETERELNIDHAHINQRVRDLYKKMEGGVGIRFEFTSEHSIYIDLRYRKPRMEINEIKRNENSSNVINLPTGTVSIVPYEGEKIGEQSITEGEIPIKDGEDIIVISILQNKIDKIRGMGNFAGKIRYYMSQDQNRGNLAEIGFGLNDKIRYKGEPQNDQKNGVHFSFGRSDHLGGNVSIKDFKTPTLATYYSIVYPPRTKTTIKNAILYYEDKSREFIIQDGVFSI